jgi:Na+(H+)/acetate symporter ActP
MSAGGWLIVLLTLAAANLPFATGRLFGVAPMPGGRVKGGWWCLGELVVLYLAVGAIGFAVEARAGNRFAQTWQFYAVTACLFLVFAFPGFTCRYLLKWR